MTAKRPASRSTTRKTASAKKTVTAARSRTPLKAKATAKPKPKPKPNAKTTPRTTAKAKARSVTRKVAASKPASRLRDVVLGALAELKAVDVKALDVRGLTDITDTMVVASGTSDRHVKSIAERVTQRCKEAGFRPYGMEGERDGEWVLLDLQDVVLHVMLPRVREFYALEKLGAGGAAA
jgi:ribosome-associated protein